MSMQFYFADAACEVDLHRYEPLFERLPSGFCLTLRPIGNSQGRVSVYFDREQATALQQQVNNLLKPWIMRCDRCFQSFMGYNGDIKCANCAALARTARETDGMPLEVIDDTA